MNKAVEILEKNVQWMTLGAGVVFVGLMGWRYLVTQPTVDINGEHLSAGKVDQAIAEGPVAALESKLNGGVPPKLLLPVYDQAFREGMKNGPTTRPLEGAWTTGRGLGIDLPAGTGSSSTRPAFNPSEAPVAGAGAAGLVSKLEVLPAATPLGTSQGLSTVNAQAIVSAAQAGLQAAQAAAGQAIPPEAGQPLPPGGAVVAVQGVDREWVTAGFEIDVAAIGQQYQAAGIPAGLLTSFLRVEIQREELLADGTYGNPVIVKPLANSLLSQNPMPAAGNLQAETTYLPWAQANQSEILQPGFFTVLSGAGWAVPGQVGGVVGAASAFDPAKYLTGPIPESLTQEQRTQVMQARARERQRVMEEERKKAAERGRGSRPPGASEGAGGGEGPGFGGPGGGGGGGGGRGGRGGGRYKMPPPQISALPPGSMPGLPSFVSGGVGTGSAEVAAQGAFAMAWATEVLGAEIVSSLGMGPWGATTGGLATVAQNIPPRWTPPAGMNEPPGAGQEPMPGAEGGMPGAPIVNAPNLGQIPSGPFDPQAWVGGKIITFQHDESVEAGKTYRYRARYVMHNPVFQQQAAVSVPALATQFRWESQWSTWTEAVAVPPKVSFFVTRITSGSAPAAQVEVFRYLRGQMRSKTFAVLPGDAIGSADASGDFSTGYTLVDVRVGGREGYAVVMAPDGAIARRDGSDQRSPKYSQLKAQTTPPAAPSNTPPAGGVPPMGTP